MSGDTTEVFPTPAAIFRRVSRTNTRLPPIATKAAVPGKIATISRGKLQHEAASQTPNLRRCVGHQFVFLKSTEAAQEERRRQMSHLSFDDDDESTPGANERSEPEIPAIREQVTKTVKAIIRRRPTTASEKSTLVRVSAPELQGHENIQPATDKKKRFLVKSRKYASMILSGRRAYSPVLQSSAVY